MDVGSTDVPFSVEDSRNRCRVARRRILDISQSVAALHGAPAFSCLEIVDAVYYGLMRRSPLGTFVDTFIMSKGHGYLAQLVALEALGVISSKVVDEYCTPHGLLGAHPDRGVPGITAATGSLGHGLGIALGIAVADRNSSLRDDDNPGTTFVVLSDGELQEGSTWEAILLASSLSLPNLVAIVDNNDFQSLGRTSETHPSLYPIDEKFRAFGWEAVNVDGHASEDVVRAVASRSGVKPLAVVAKTTKGKGVSFMEDVPIWHYRSPSPDEYRQAIAELAGDRGA